MRSARSPERGREPGRPDALHPGRALPGGPPWPPVAVPVHAQLLGLRPRGARAARRAARLVAEPPPDRPLPPVGRPRVGPRARGPPRPDPKRGALMFGWIAKILAGIYE